MFRDIYSVFIR